MVHRGGQARARPATLRLMEKPREPARPAPEPTLDLPLHRCPFCHDAVSVDDGTWVGCAKCLARHHAACWDEGKACGACRHPQRLVPEPFAPVAPGAAGAGGTSALVLIGLAGLLMLGGVSAAVAT